jgi:hypothetical protein
MLIIETGQGGADSESYASAAQADTYFANRGMTNWATMSTNEKEQALRRACDYMTRQYGSMLVGTRVSDTQALDFPRINVPNLVSGYYASNIVPRDIVNANIELAIRAAAGELDEDLDAPVIEETVGSLTVKYAAGASRTKKFPALDKLLSSFLVGGGVGGSIRLVRA